MNKLNTFLLASTALTGLAATSSLAASSGNFSATVDNFQCAINSSTGVLTGTSATFTSTGAIFDIGPKDVLVQIANGAGTTLIVTPSLVTGLFTDNKITNTISTSTQDVGIQIQVTVKPAPGTVLSSPIKIAPNTTGAAFGGFNLPADSCALPSGSPSGSVTTCVIYDQRFIQISSDLLTELANVFSFSTAFELVESTLSAHSFNFYVSAPGGSYTFDVDAELFIGNSNTAGAGSVAGCAGPGTVTVQQVKNFSFDTPITF